MPWSLSANYRTAGRLVTDVLFPPCCLACNSTDELPDDGVFLCQPCRDLALSPAKVKFCRRCAKQTVDDSLPDCAECRESKLHFTWAAVLHNYDGTLRELVLNMKRRPGEALALSAGRWLGRKLLNEGWGEMFDVIVPIPTYWFNRLLKGYHAADPIALGCAQTMGKRYMNDVLLSARWPRRQATLTSAARRRNMRKAFYVARRFDVKGCRVLIVDDVITTGATMNAAAQVLMQAGAEEVVVAAVARSTGQ
jgi:ComF family protein